MQTNDQFLTELRPNIPQATTNVNTTPVETFQNQTLRPILKFLNFTILETVMHHMTRFNKNFDQLTEIKKREEVVTALNKNQHIRYTLLGQVQGFLTQEELSIFFNNASEYHKRINQMIEQRVLDGLFNN
ncbi:MAG: hypothetical protein AB8B74_10540 [Crocinitomicaceae bacterium]